MDENQRNRKRVKRGLQFRALRLRDDRKDADFLGGHHIAFALINLRHILQISLNRFKACCWVWIWIGG